MNYKFWFIVGSQHLYGPETLKQVEVHAKEMEAELNKSEHLPFELMFKGVLTTPKEITDTLTAANASAECAGIVSWMHTFSPSKMWIEGLSKLEKPYLHVNTQYNRDIPYETIDMDFMNLNQSAHGDREHGFITARLRMRRKVISGYWRDDCVRERIGGWMRSAVGAIHSRTVKVMRLGDNMREVAVTEGDKIAAQRDLGWSVNTYPVGDLAERILKVTEAQADAKMAEYEEKYDIKTDDIAAVRYQAKIDVALGAMLEEGGFAAYTNTFENLYGMEQLPGLASQNLMSRGYGFGAEGDWKTSAMQAVIGAMSSGLSKGYSFIEDYTYNLGEGEEAVLGAHMLEISPAIAENRPEIQVHALGIGGKNPPARLVFEGKSGPAILVTLVDMGNRFRLVVHDVDAIPVPHKMPKLPVASVMWKPMPDMTCGNEAWILSGGAHHSVISFDLTAENMKDFAEIMGIECIHIGADTKLDDLKLKLLLGDRIWNK